MTAVRLGGDPMDSGGMDVNSVRRVLLILWFAFVWTLGMYGVVLFVLEPQASHPTALSTIMAILAAATGAAALYLRLGRAGKILSNASPPNTQELGQLRTTYTLCFALSEAVAIFGLVLYLVGSSRTEVLPYFAAALVLLLVCFPRIPS